MDLKKILPIILPVVIFILMELVLLLPAYLYFLITLMLISLFFTVDLYRKVNPIKNWLVYFLLPALFVFSSQFFITLLTSNILIQLLILITAIFVYVYLRNLYYLFINIEKYTENSFENITAYANFLSMFFIFSIVFGLQSFLNTPIYLLAIGLIPIIAMVVYQVLVINQLYKKEYLIYIFTATIILTEITWAGSFLPLNFAATGLSVAICYYIIIGLIRFHLKHNLNKNKVKQYLFFGFSCILLVLLTSQWI